MQKEAHGNTEFLYSAVPLFLFIFLVSLFFFFEQKVTCTSMAFEHNVQWREHRLSLIKEGTLIGELCVLSKEMGVFPSEKKFPKRAMTAFEPNDKPDF